MLDVEMQIFMRRNVYTPELSFSFLLIFYYCFYFLHIFYVIDGNIFYTVFNYRLNSKNRKETVINIVSN